MMITEKDLQMLYTDSDISIFVTKDSKPFTSLNICDELSVSLTKFMRFLRGFQEAGTVKEKSILLLTVKVVRLLDIFST